MDIKTYLAQSGRSLTNLANEVGTSVGSMHDLASGRRTPSLRMAAKIAKATGGAVSVESFIQRENSVKAAE